MSGSATFTIVMSSSSMNVATQTATSVHHLRSMTPTVRQPPLGRFIEMSAFPERRADEPARELPHSLWERLRSDPARAPEYVALAAAERHAPAAAAWVEERKRMYAHSPAELAQMAKRRHATLARFGGAATGVGGIVTAIPDLAAAAWIQSRLVFFIAAAYGYDPYDPMRPAELLVIRGLYATPQEARLALDGAGTMVARPTSARGSSATRRSRPAWRASSAGGWGAASPAA